jgi:hypothetical protein
MFSLFICFSYSICLCDLFDPDPIELAAKNFQDHKPRQLSKSAKHSAFNKKILIVGLSKQDVQKILGKPYDIEFAGEPRLENEKWIYHKLVQLTKGYSTVYFKNGIVVAWE